MTVGNRTSEKTAAGKPPTASSGRYFSIVFHIRFEFAQKRNGHFIEVQLKPDQPDQEDKNQDDDIPEDDLTDPKPALTTVECVEQIPEKRSDNDRDNMDYRAHDLRRPSLISKKWRVCSGNSR